MLGYAKFMKDLVTKKRTISFQPTKNLHHCSATTTMSLVEKKEDPSEFTISCTIGAFDFNLMSLVIYIKFGLRAPKLTSMRLLMVDRPVKRLVGILCDLLVDFEVPIILERSFLATGRALMDVESGELTFRINDEEVKFNVCTSIKKPKDMIVISVFVVEIESVVDVPIKERLAVEPLVAIIMNFKGDNIERYDESINALQGVGSHTYDPKKLDLDLKNRPTPPAKPSIDEPPVLELKELTSHLRYIFLGENNTLLVIIAVDMSERHVTILVEVLQRYKKAIG
ncbi:uncharacterized protein LOC129894752 [Solanum dulcamara]|uniref:uncharacterized protein LOC129894752 n=1 Tax=Solanum dulcamara TaxID=45834 RepID=UPI002485061C|nr:uncharacterized protein LOC129894752 [Solanum dulcamara]